MADMYDRIVPGSSLGGYGAATRAASPGLAVVARERRGEYPLGMIA